MRWLIIGRSLRTANQMGRADHWVHHNSTQLISSICSSLPYTWPCSTRHDTKHEKSPTRTRHDPMKLGPGLARPAAQAVLGLTPKPVAQHGPT